MPMILRSRKSIRTATAAEDMDSGSSEGSPRPGRRRSTRVNHTGAQPKYYEEEEHDSDSDLGQNLDFEREAESASAAEEADVEVKYCSVLLSRFDQGDREEMSRRSGLPKPVSRIPTFHKKTTTVTTTAATEASRAKTPEVKERSLPMPTIRFSSSDFAGGETMTTTTSYSFTHIATPRTAMDSFITVSPRPGIRADREWNMHFLEQSKTGSGSGGEEEEERGTSEETERREERGDGGERGDNDNNDDDDDEGGRRSEEQEELFITEEQPPWESPTADTEVKEDVESGSEPELEEEPSELPSEAEVVQSEAENVESILAETRPTEEEAPAPAADQNTDSHGQDEGKSSWCASLLLRCFVPLLLLLFGGLAQHLWLYGLPRSVEQLGAQLELHWLEGIVPAASPCSSECRVSLVESVPVGLYPSAPAPRESIAQSWLRLLDRAETSADIAAFYVTLRSADGEPTDAQGRLVLEKLKTLSSNGVNVRVAVNAPQSSTQDTEELAAAGAEVREVDLTALTGGIIHTKLWALDQTHLYLGSANMDWRSLSQVKEVGVAVEDCSCLAQDVARVFEVYWSVGGANGSLPPYWPARLSALSSAQEPLNLKINGVPAQVYLSSAPPQLSTRGRTDDLAAILSVMEDAQQFIHVSVMDLLPQSLYTKPPRFWPPLDSALRAAACSRRVQVRLLVSCWPHSKAAMFVFLQSLLVLNRPPLNCDIQVKVFTVPSTPEQLQIPYARVNHAKYMVTDRVVYIGTSNWSEDYFTQTAGVGLVVNQTGSEPGPGLETLQSQAEQLFLRDWTSVYATELSVDQTDACPKART